MTAPDYFTRTTLFDKPDNLRTFSFVVEEKSIWIDKALLAQESKVFSTKLLDERFADSKEKTIELPGKKHSEMVEFFACLFWYPTKNPICNDNFKRNVELADEYDVKKMFNVCSSFLISSTSSLGILNENDLKQLLSKNVYQTCFKYPQFHWFVVQVIPYMARLTLSPYMPDFPPAVMYALLEALNNANQKVHNWSVVKSGSCNCVKRPSTYFCKLCNKHVCPKCYDSYNRMSECAFTNLHAGCSFKETKICKLACEYRNFDVERLIIGLHEFSSGK